MGSSVPRLLRNLGLLALALLVAAEVGVRMAGLVDFPLYDADAVIGYVPKASQRGSFMNQHDWVINAQHMGADAFVPGPAGNLLLVGDSIVWGGNPYAQADRLGPRLQALVKARVWPISAGSWGLQNELTWLNANEAVVAQVDTIVLVLNKHDLKAPSAWNCSLTHPREPPVFALWFLARKHLMRGQCEGTPEALKVPVRDPVAMLRSFGQSHLDKRLLVVLYPDTEDAASDTVLHDQLEAMTPVLAAAGVREIVSVGRDPRWRGKPQLYRDGAHPTPEGNGVLAGIIASSLNQRAP